MKYSYFCLGLLVATMLGCGPRMPPEVLPDQIAADAPTKAMELYDTNRDGAIAGTELDQAPGLKVALPILDPNKSGKITAEALADRIKSWHDTGVGRLAVTLRVLHKKGPLVGAQVRLIPEKFLGDGLQTAVGVTNANGNVVVKTHAGNAEIAGVSPGFYRVEITKAGEPIPAKYNTSTTLGAVVDFEALNTKPEFDLEY